MVMLPLLVATLILPCLLPLPCTLCLSCLCRRGSSGCSLRLLCLGLSSSMTEDNAGCGLTQQGPWSLTVVASLLGGASIHRL